MATASTSSQKKNQRTLRIFILLLLFLFTLFILSRDALEPQLSIYRDLFVQTRPPSSLNLPLRSTETLISADPELDDNAVALIGKNGLNTSPENPISSKVNLEDETSANLSLADGNDASLDAPASSKSNLDGEFHEKSTTKEHPTSSKSDFGDKDTGKEAPVDGKETSSEGLFSSDSGNDNEVRKDSTSSSQSDDDLSNTKREKEGPVSEIYSEDFALWKGCDFYKGKWVKDEQYPIYRPGSCPYVDEAFDCQSNGRPDSEYLKWRWKPDGCDLPRFNATDFLVRLRGKRLMLVGDSMNRNQFESLLCILREGLHNKSKMYEVHGYKITKGRGYYIFKFEDYNCTVEFVRSHFLVKEGIRINAQGNSNPTLSIDRIDKSAGRWKRADILVFNTAHWWTHGKTARGGGDWDSGGTCIRETEPVVTGSILDSYPLKMKIVEEVIQEMKVPVCLLNITRLTNFRKDGHPSVYGKNVTGGRKVSAKRQDCSHWCLPGVPDAWNELIYATLVTGQGSLMKHY
ncbi:protein trichome birefringence-like 5 isoform X2 [Coffea eugenioides]|uniref:protein trichome birefringence-like 5 isoform X2 n=1 Tax=Coffea eugenioides TaxID=49369 RepID=UPI000F60A3EF|nr:protein trichome birefringence-like 5 isoform X2 [Coffea eugenioides]